MGAPARSRSRPAGPPGFTLVELLITLIVMAVITAIAVPSYLGGVRTSRRSDVIAEVARLQQAQERFRAQALGYAADVSSSATGLRLAPGTSATDTYATPGGFYVIRLGDADATGYTVTAQAVEGSSQADDAGCQCLRLTWRGGSASYSAAAFSGGRCGGFAGANAARCWRR